MSSVDLYNALASVTKPTMGAVDFATSLAKSDRAGTARRQQMAQALDALHQVNSGFSDTGGGGGVVPESGGAVSGNVNSWISTALRDIGQPDNPQLHSAVASLVRHESGGNPKAVNRWDKNWAAGHPSMGLAQTISSTFAQYRDPKLSGDIFDPVSNLVAGLRYGISRYGSIMNIPGIASILRGGSYRGY